MRVVVKYDSFFGYIAELGGWRSWLPIRRYCTLGFGETPEAARDDFIRRFRCIEFEVEDRPAHD